MENLYGFKGYGVKNLVRNFCIKVGALRGLNKLFKNELQETGTTASGSIESIHIFLLVFLFCNIHTQTGCYKKGISH